MKFFVTHCLMLFCLFSFVYSQGAKRVNGPVIEKFGEVFAVENPDFQTDINKEYKVVFDIHDTSSDPSRINAQINTLARFINMHAQAGVPLENLHVACVIHNKASKDALDNETYKEEFGVDNPNVPLLEALEKAGANIYMCGQSISARGIDRERLASPVKVGLSAMTVILSLEAEGYHLIKF